MNSNNFKTYRFSVTHTEIGYVDITAKSKAAAEEQAEEQGCENMEINKCYTDIKYAETIKTTIK